MGVTYSEAKEQEPENVQVLKKQQLRLSYDDAEKLINAFFIHQFQPVTQSEELQTLFYAAYGKRLETELKGTMISYQRIFQNESSMYVHTIMMIVMIIVRIENNTSNNKNMMLILMKIIIASN